MSEDALTQSAMAFVHDLLGADASGHDDQHCLRVYRLAMALADREGGDRRRIALAALLHDADDRKLFDTGDTLTHARQFLAAQGTADAEINAICRIIHGVSYHGDAPREKPDTLEGCIVQDADRLDAMGAIGIARTFAYGGSRGRKLYDPDDPPAAYLDEQAYAARQSSSINHFYEKLLKLKDLMNTPAARDMADARHQVMLTFLDEFTQEWNGKK